MNFHLINELFLSLLKEQCLYLRFRSDGNSYCITFLWNTQNRQFANNFQCLHFSNNFRWIIWYLTCSSVVYNLSECILRLSHHSTFHESHVKRHQIITMASLIYKPIRQNYVPWTSSGSHLKTSWRPQDFPV